MRRTYQPSIICKKRKHGFINRMKSKVGSRLINRRRKIGRKFL